MRLAELIGRDAGACADVLVRGVCLDSRAVQTGDAFFALRGANQHGISFAPAALARGASVVLAESLAPARSLPEASNEAAPVVWLEGLSERAGAIAARFFGEPSQALRVVGVTGTNGKTSTVQLLTQAWSLLGTPSASIGTLGAGLHGNILAGERTTPDVLNVQRLLADFRDAGASDVAMEVSSHALQQGRVNAVLFTLAVFTNLTRDHLDFHGSMEAYGEAKARLFASPGLRSAVINIDDPFGAALATRLPATLTALTYGLAPGADVRADSIQLDSHGLAFELISPWGRAGIRSPLLGQFNVANLLGVCATLGALGYGFDALISTIGKLQPVPGRMNRLGGEGSDPLVVVDYAHTPDALQQALTSLRAHCAGRLICLFGCGGERDQGKRPQMASIAEQLADVVVVTDDNPRGEDADHIVAQICAGLRQPQRAHVERDRARAIDWAVRQANPQDVVLIAGKGHEPYQEIGAQRHPFDDTEVARHALGAARC
ncbi:MAG: UDP-N-acetylmuramoyl-L-alanyl-D-glutamate--2,6-diaminopimelate ligase [Tahibacter sp.]